MSSLLDIGFPRQSILSDRKSTRLNSSHSQISYAVFCLKKKKETHIFRLSHGIFAASGIRIPAIYILLSVGPLCSKPVSTAVRIEHRSSYLPTSSDVVTA